MPSRCWAFAIACVLLGFVPAARAQSSIQSFAANPTIVTFGASTTLTWSVTGGDSIRISEIDHVSTLLSGSVVAAPISTTSYLLRLYEGGAIVDSYAVAVIVVGPFLASFAAEPEVILLGENSELSWSAPAGDSLLLKPLGIWIRDLEGTMDVSPAATTTYRLELYHGGLRTNTRTALVEVSGPKILEFQADPNPVVYRAPVTLTWERFGGDRVEIASLGLESTDPTGTFVVEPLATTLYQLDLYDGPVLVDSETVLAAVDPPVVTSFTVDPTSVLQGEAVTLAWTTTGCDSIAIARAEFVSTDAAGSTTDIPYPGLGPYRLDLYWQGGVVDTEIRPVTVSPASILSFGASPTQVEPGETIHLSWNVAGTADSVVIEPLGFVSTATAGSADLVLVDTHDLTLFLFVGGALTDTHTLTNLLAAPNIKSFSATPVYQGGEINASLAWQVTNLDSLVIDPIGFRSTNALGVTQDSPGGPRTYTLTAHYNGYTDQALVVFDPTVSPQFSTFEVTPTQLYPGDAIYVQWSAAPPSSVVYLQGRGPYPATGQRTVFAGSSGLVSVAALDGPDAVVASIPVTVFDPVPGADGIYLVGDLVTLEPLAHAGTFSTLLHVVTFDTETPFHGYEFSLDWPGCVNVQGLFLPPGAVNTGTGIDYIISLPCQPGTGMTVLATFQFGHLDRPPCTALPVQLNPVPTLSKDRMGVVPCTGPAFRPFAPAKGLDWIKHGTAAPPVRSAAVDRIDSIRPNPFNPRTEVLYTLQQEGTAELRVVNLAGRSVKRVILASRPPGQYGWSWDGTDDAGSPVGSGVYFVRLATRSGVDTRKAVLLK